VEIPADTDERAVPSVLGECVEADAVEHDVRAKPRRSAADSALLTTAAAGWIAAAKLWSVLSARNAMRLNSLSLPARES
jgi:hypothetical protein